MGAMGGMGEKEKSKTKNQKSKIKNKKLKTRNKIALRGERVK